MNGGIDIGDQLERHPEKFTVEELCCTVFHLARYAEAMEIDRSISVPDEQELFWIIFEWAKDFENTFDTAHDYQGELETRGAQWLRETFPYTPEMDESQTIGLDMM